MKVITSFDFSGGLCYIIKEGFGMLCFVFGMMIGGTIGALVILFFMGCSGVSIHQAQVRNRDGK